MQLSQVEVKFTDLNISADVLVGSRAMPTVLNAFVNYQVNDRLGLSVSANNLGNATGYTEVEGDGHAARSINGRTVKASVKYTF